MPAMAGIGVTGILYDLHHRPVRGVVVGFDNDCQAVVVEPHQRPGGVDADGLDKSPQQIFSKVAIGHAVELPKGFDRCNAALVWAIGCQCVINVDDRGKLGVYGYLLARQGIWIAGSIDALMVEHDDFEHQFSCAGVSSRMIWLSRT